MGKKRALLFGASGFIGRFLLKELLENPAYGLVTIVVRKTLNIRNVKLKELIGDYHSLSQLREALVADDVFCALGTTKKKTPDLELYYQIDHDYPVEAARISKENGAKAFFLVSSIGANASSSIFYTRTKGKTEQDIIALGFESTHIFRPSALIGNRKESRPLEKISGSVLKALNPLLIGSWRRYRSIDGKAVASAINNSAAFSAQGVVFYYWDDIKRLS